ncbi:metal ABC transporter solute-binding protein, Zn/Mn family [Dendronalium sp. ChiSLP03b]|nr:zinc ABC transporter substrate-binding protein [Dendronalium sp. ChiSLP03b]MDZ8209187.1 zinc ABC transporter substrate-binding protein [Dendronalium sp. ChiSLP03b]
MSKKLPSNNSLQAGLVALTIGFAGCGNQAVSTSFTQTTSINENLPQVVATTSVLCDLIKQVAENTINLTCLISPGQDPHVYQPSLEDRKAIEQANLILYNGYNFEPGLIGIIKATKNSTPKIAVAQLAVPKPQQFRQAGRRVTDPHIWHNAKNTISMVEVISNNLKKLEPSNAATYSDNTRQIKNQLIQMDSWIKSRIASIPSKQRKLITTHNALGYYAKAYGLSLAGAIEGISTGRKPTSTQMKNLVKNIQQAKIPTIFAETTMNPELIQSVAQEVEVKVSEKELYTDGLGESRSDGDTYQKMMVSNTRTIVEGLGGTYLRFKAKER